MNIYLLYYKAQLVSVVDLQSKGHKFDLYPRHHYDMWLERVENAIPKEAK